MHKRPFKITMIMLFLLTFISQAMASSLMSYTMIEQHVSFDNFTSAHVPTDNSTLIVSEHSDNTLDNINSGEHGKKCCSKNKTCLIFGCATAALVSELFAQQAVINNTIIYSPLTVATFSQQPKSLYRPPIFS